MATESEILTRYNLMKEHLDERELRFWAGAEAIAHGRGDRELVARATGLGRNTVSDGKKKVMTKAPDDLVKVKRKEGGAKGIEEQQPGITEALEMLVDPVTRGDPESALRWTCKSTRALEAEMKAKGFNVSQHKDAEMLRRLGYSLQATQKSYEGEQHPDRDAQFRHINDTVEKFIAEGQPVVSVDTKKKELIGEFQNRGREWQPEKALVLVNVHDFPSMAVGKAIPYGVYDIAKNCGWVSVGIDHDTPMFAVNSIRSWWFAVGRVSYGDSRELLITADSGGSAVTNQRSREVAGAEIVQAVPFREETQRWPVAKSSMSKTQIGAFKV